MQQTILRGFFGILATRITMESAVMTSRITSVAFHNVGYVASTLIETSPSFFVGSSALASLDTRTRRKKPAPPTILTSAPVFRSECLRLGCLFGFSGGWHGCHPFLETVWCLFTIFNSRSLGQEFVEQQIGRGSCDGWGLLQQRIAAKGGSLQIRAY